jgi:hypothetical protein
MMIVPEAPMDAAAPDAHKTWLGYALEEAQRRGLADAAFVIGFANPEVLVSQLPRDVTARLIAGALSSGTMSPSAVLEVAPPALMAEHLDPEVLWRCVAGAAVRAGLDARDSSATNDARGWLESILQRAIDDRLVTPADVVRHIPPAEFVRDAPLAVVAELIRSGLTGGKFDPSLVLTHLTPHVIANNLPPVLGWSCVSDALISKLGGAGDAPVIASVEKPRENGKAAKGAAPAPARNPPPRPNQKQVEQAKIDAVPPKRPGSNLKLGDDGDWTDGIAESTDVEVLEDQPLPPPPAVQKR